MKQKKVKRNDRLLITGLFAVTLLLLIWQNTAGAREGAFVVVTLDGEEKGSYSLRKEARIPMISENGYNLLIIGEGKAWIEEADCPDGLCRRQKAISREGESLICLPHRLAVTVTGALGGETDAVAY